MSRRRKRAEQRILVLDIEHDAFIFVPRREANLYPGALQRLPGAEIIAHPLAFPPPPWAKPRKGAA